MQYMLDSMEKVHVMVKEEL